VFGARASFGHPPRRIVIQNVYDEVFSNEPPLCRGVTYIVLTAADVLHQFDKWFTDIRKFAPDRVARAATHSCPGAATSTIIIRETTLARWNTTVRVVHAIAGHVSGDPTEERRFARAAESARTVSERSGSDCAEVHFAAWYAQWVINTRFARTSSCYGRYTVTAGFAPTENTMQNNRVYPDESEWFVRLFTKSRKTLSEETLRLFFKPRTLLFSRTSSS